MTRIYILTLLSVVAGLLLQSCDPTYPISINNTTEDTLIITARTTNNFQSYKVKDLVVLSSSLYGKWVQFTIPPKSYVECGMAIAEIDDEIPFSELIIYNGQDSIYVASTKKEVKNLFETNMWGFLETPYEIKVEYPPLEHGN